jgi:hypothetical protein
MKTQLIKEIAKKAKITNTLCLEKMNITQLTHLLEKLHEIL